MAEVRESLSDALVRHHRTDAPSVPWYRAIDADGEVEGRLRIE